MFPFGKRNVNKQGGSYLVSLPMEWMKAVGTDLKKVTVEMDADNTLRIAPADAAKQPAGAATTSEGKAEACQ